MTVAGHPFVTGDKIQIKDESIVFRCQQDSFGSDHAYPRKQDPASNNAWLSVTYVDANSFSVNVGTSSNTTTHNFQSAATGAIIRGVVKGGGSYAHTFVSAADGGIMMENSTIKLDVGESRAKGYGVSAASYVPNTGLLTMTIGTHQLKVGNYVKIANKSMVFRCDQDSQNSDHWYPRPTGWGGATGNDPAYNNRVEITAVTADGITVDVGTSSNTTTHVFQNANNTYSTETASYNPATGFMTLSVPKDKKTASGAAYNPTAGTLELTIGSHTLTTDDTIRLLPNSLTFTCDYGGDGNVTTKTYPRAAGAATTSGADYAYNQELDITAVSGTTITVNVNGGQGAVTDTTTHVWQASTANGILVGNGFINGEYVKIADNSLTFTCGKDNNVTNHSYPRSSDPSSGRWLKISNVNCDQFDVQVLTDIPSTNTTVHTYVSSNASNVERSVVTIGLSLIHI